MEDDDEFGDLYTDVLRPFQPSSAPQPPPEPPTRPPPNRLIDLNINSDDEEILYGAPSSNPKFNFTSSQQSQTLVLNSQKAAPVKSLGGSSSYRLNLNFSTKQEDEKVEKNEGLADGTSNRASDLPEPSASRVLGSGVVQGRGFGAPNLVDESGLDFVIEEGDDKDDLLIEKDELLMARKEDFEKFDVEDVPKEIADIGSESLIPSQLIPGVSDSVDHQNEAGDDWDSDSDDDLQIVLNDNHQVTIVTNRPGAVGSDDDDEDGDPLVIIADSEPGHQPMEEQEWGVEAAPAVDGERKELGDAAKVNGGVAVAPRIAFNNHPYHSQFKYVRPGAAPVPGASPVGPPGAPGQARPPINMGPVTGFGRGDWRPPGIKNASPMQKNIHTGFGMPVWGNNPSGRGFGSGLDFTLPSHKTIFEVDIDSFEEKPWRLPGLDITDFFNFGLNEESWKDYCKQLEQLRLETTMQSKIRVYESGRTEQEYDPDLPPELAAAAGNTGIKSENANLGKMDACQSNTAKESAQVRPPFPTGRAIPVETGYGERLPSIDTRPPRIRDSDAIIEIVLQASADDSSFPGNDVTEQPENAPSTEDFRGGPEIGGDLAEGDNERLDGLPHAYNSRKRELVGRRPSVMNSIQDNHNDGDGNFPFPPEVPDPYSPDSRVKTSAYPGKDLGMLHDERQTKGRAHDRSPNKTHSGSTLDKRFLDNQKDDSVESIGGKQNSRLSSPVTGGSGEEPDVEHGDDGLHDDVVLADESSGMDREDITLDRTAAAGTHIDENRLPSVKKQKLSSQVEQSSLQGTGGEFKAARSTENSKARSESSRDFQKLRDRVEEEVDEHERPSRMGNLKRHRGQDELSVRRKGRDERHEIEKHLMAGKGREDSYSRRDLDPRLAHHSHMQTDGIDRRKERDNSAGSWQRRDDDPHGRRARVEDTRKQEHGDEMGSRHRSKVGESEKDDHLQLRKQLENGNSRDHYDKDVGSRHRERDDHLKKRYENMDEHYIRRKGEEHLRRDAEKEEILHGHRENTSHRKRERDDVNLDLHKRDDQVRTRDDDHHFVRHKEDGWIHTERADRLRERDEWHRLNQSHEETILKREREEGRGGIRSGRSAEDKVRFSHARVKDEYKSSDRDYQFKDTGRPTEQLRRRDRVEDGSFSQHRGREDVYARGNQLSNDERRPRQERASSRSDRAVGGADNSRAHERKRKDNTRKSKDFDGGDQNSMVPSKRNQEDQSGHVNEPVRSNSRNNNIPFHGGKKASPK